MQFEFLYYLAAFWGSVWAALHIISLVKRVLCESNATITKVTDEGETVHMTCSFYVYENSDQKSMKLEEVFKHTDARKWFCGKRYEAYVEEQIAKQNEEKLKAVK